MSSQSSQVAAMDEADRAIINELQRELPVCEYPFREIGAQLGISEEEILRRLSILHSEGVLTRFGPLFNAERMGGALTLAAIAAPPDRFDEIAEAINAFPEVAHNYARGHRLNMWFVLATDAPERIMEVIGEIEAVTGCQVHNFPKREEFYVGLHFNA